jgi:glycosyltransferase involved in cell wall biosynthesis
LIVIASYSGLFGGAERVLYDCATRMTQPVTVMCPNGPLATALKQVKVPHEPIPERTLKKGPAHLAGLLAMARDLRGHGRLVAWGARAVLAAALARRPFVAVHHDRNDWPILRAASRRADASLAASQAIAEVVGADMVLHPGVDLDQYTPAPLPAGPPRAIVLGALVGWKRPDLAIEIARRMPELHVTFAGEPMLGFKPPAATPNVTFAGRVEDVSAALAQAHLLLHCADREPYGLALVEALAAGRPVVAPDAGGPREIVADGAGRLYPPGDAAAAAAAIRAVLNDPDAPAKARARAERFDVNESVRRFEAAL